MIETLLLNAIIQTRDYGILVRHGLNDPKHFHDQSDAYKFIRDHLATYGEMPSVQSVVEHVEKQRAITKGRIVQPFEPMEVTESPDTLCMKLIERNVRLGVKQLLTELATDFGRLDGYQLLDKMKTGVDQLTETALRRGRGGVNWTTSGNERFAEYQQRQQRDYSVKIPLMLPELTQVLGGCERGDILTLMAFTGKGKSWLGLLSALAVNKVGLKVLIESAEMSKEKVQFRLDTLEGGFNNRGLWTGQLGATEERYRQFTSQFTPGNGRPDLIIRTPEDWPSGLTLEQLEADINRFKSDVVVIDQFNLMRFRGATKEAKADLSRQLKQLAARLGIVIVLLYQTNGEYEKSTVKDEDGIRELKLPTLADYSETIAVIQDSAIVLGFDAVTFKDESTGRRRGKALLGVLKGRDGGDGETFELDWLPNDGIIRCRTATDVF